MNIFLHHRDLRYQDNTTMIKQCKGEKNVTPIFIFDPIQIDPEKNSYFPNNLN
jgi:deoxyribodipyrimidine photolyase